MTIPQKKYFIKRIDEVASQKVRKLQDNQSSSECIIAKQGLKSGDIQYTDFDKMKSMIDKSLDRARNGWSGSNLGTVDVRDLIEGFEVYEKQVNAELAAENDKISEKRQLINEEATRIKDQAMFGSEQEAYEMLNQFVEMKV